jgi:hypothetical protein
MTKSVQLNLAKPTIDPVDAMLLQTLVQHLHTVDLQYTEQLCERIAGVYAKNIGYFLLSLESLTRFDLPASKAFLAKICVTPPNMFDRALVAKTSLENMIRTVEHHFDAKYTGYIFPQLSRLQILQEFHYLPPIVQTTIANSMERMNASRPQTAAQGKETVVGADPLIPQTATELSGSLEPALTNSDDDLYS